MKKLIILIEIIILILLIYIAVPKQGNGAEPKYYLMTITAYSLHHDCIADKWNDGLTASNTPIREGVAAINVDYILNLGDKIYIEGLGNYSVEDTGYFTDEDYKQDFWNIDIYVENYQRALEFGRQLRKVYLIEGGK